MASIIFSQKQSQDTEGKFQEQTVNKFELAVLTKVRNVHAFLDSFVFSKVHVSIHLITAERSYFM